MEVEQCHFYHKISPIPIAIDFKHNCSDMSKYESFNQVSIKFQSSFHEDYLRLLQSAESDKQPFLL